MNNGVECRYSDCSCTNCSRCAKLTCPERRFMANRCGAQREIKSYWPIYGARLLTASKHKGAKSILQLYKRADEGVDSAINTDPHRSLPPSSDQLSIKSMLLSICLSVTLFNIEVHASRHLTAFQLSSLCLPIPCTPLPTRCRCHLSHSYIRKIGYKLSSLLNSY